MKKKRKEKKKNHSFINLMWVFVVDVVLFWFGCLFL